MGVTGSWSTRTETTTMLIQERIVNFFPTKPVSYTHLYLNGGSFRGEQILTKEWVRDSMDVSAAYSRPGANQDVYNAIGYGYQMCIRDRSPGRTRFP